jgi:hypothetical protein
MPRWNLPREARSEKAILSLRPIDKATWKEEAKAQGISLSRWIYLRARAAGPLPGPGSKDPQLSRELSALGNGLNQLVRIFHGHGMNAEAAAEALALVHSIQQRLTR